MLIGALVLLGLATAGAAHATSTGQATMTAPTLSIEPSSGAPGSKVTAVARGYQECRLAQEPSVEKPSAEESPGREPALADTPADQGAAGVVVFVWDTSVELKRVPVSTGGSATITFTVPESATARRYWVESRCDGDESMTQTVPFRVTGTDKPSVVVPGVVGLNADQARKALADKGLLLGRTSGDGDKIQSQNPAAGKEVASGSKVDVDLGKLPPLVAVPNLVDGSQESAEAALASVGLKLGSVEGRGDVVRVQNPVAGREVRRGTAVDISVVSLPPQTVTVPDLVGASAAEVPTILRGRWLVLGQVSGDGDVVRQQSPKAGSRVRIGSAVTISTAVGVDPPRLVQVPDLVGGRLAAARSALTAVGLVPGGSQEGDRDIASQQPVAGTLVPAGTTVTLTVVQPLPWRAAAAALVLLLGIGAVGYRILRKRLEHRWVRGKVRVTARQTPAAAPTITESRTTKPMPVVRIEPHADAGRSILEEV
ncbi:MULTISPECIES: PASTA domain-containing protein [Kribbella]|uniref:PASTA domain-containing protein n=1 Tax=Kribbella TaxID=182639 RepID=UPI0013052A28|nr:MULTISPECIES: PASTA domain-containing protein [Kribbella]